MDNSIKNDKEYYSIDLMHIITQLLRRLWLIILVGIVGAAIGFSVANFGIAPKYSSQIMLYVNNSSISLGSTNFSISASEISAAQSLVKTYVVILNNRTTLEKVIDKADLDYTYEQLSGMIDASPVDETEVFRVKVTCHDPYEAAKIANCIAEVLPERISEIIDGSTMEVVDVAVANLSKVSPSITNYTILGFTIGVVMAVLVIVLIVVLDDTIYDEDYIIQKYEYPILAKVPDLLDSEAAKFNYYSYTQHSRRKGGR